jgi:hypothetical protein
MLARLNFPLVNLGCYTDAQIEFAAALAAELDRRIAEGNLDSDQRSFELWVTDGMPGRFACRYDGVDIFLVVRGPFEGRVQVLEEAFAGLGTDGQSRVIQLQEESDSRSEFLRLDDQPLSHQVSEVARVMLHHLRQWYAGTPA